MVLTIVGKAGSSTTLNENIPDLVIVKVYEVVSDESKVIPSFSTKVFESLNLKVFKL